MQVRQLMTSDVCACSPQDSLSRASQVFWDYDCGCAPVVDDERRLVGIITDRDALMASYTQGRLLGDVQVSTAMSNKVICCNADDTVAAAEGLMHANQIRRLPVTNADGTLEGILSLNDIACQAARERGSKNMHVSDAEVGETLSAVCQRRSEAPVATA